MERKKRGPKGLGLSESERKERKREKDRMRWKQNKSVVMSLDTHDRWVSLAKKLGLTSRELAVALLDAVDDGRLELVIRLTDTESRLQLEEDYDSDRLQLQDKYVTSDCLQQLPDNPELLIIHTTQPQQGQVDCISNQAQSLGLALNSRENLIQAPGPATLQVQSRFGPSATYAASPAVVTATILAPPCLASTGLQHQKERQSNAPKQPRHPTRETRSSMDPLPCLALPLGLDYKRVANGDEESVSGVVARERLEKGVEFGPYEGTLFDEEQGALLSTTWELCVKGRVFFYIDGRYGTDHNWMSYVACARSAAEQNVEAFQYYGQIYFRTTRVVEPGSELRVFYSEEYAAHVGLTSELQDLTYSEDSCDYQCRLCESRHPSAKHAARHLHLHHGNPYAPNEMLPVVSWRSRGMKPSGDQEEGPGGSDCRAGGCQMAPQEGTTEEESIAGDLRKVLKSEGPSESDSSEEEFEVVAQDGHVEGEVTKVEMP